MPAAACAAPWRGSIVRAVYKETSFTISATTERVTGSRVRTVVAATVVVVLGSAVAGAVAFASEPLGGVRRRDPHGRALDDGWAMQSSLGVEAPPAAVSRPGFSTKGWFPVTLPSTVLGGLVADHEYPNLYLGTNLQDVWEPRFQVPWWYRTEFELGDVPGCADPAALRRDQLPGRRVPEWHARRGFGSGRRRVPDVHVRRHGRGPPGTNALAVRVYPVDPRHDLTITWIDWSPLAPDHGMGIWHDVWLTRTGGVTVRDPQVVSDLPLPATDHADLTVTASVTTPATCPWTPTSAGTIGTIAVLPDGRARPPGESKLVTFDPATYPQLHLTDPPVWWPVSDGRTTARGADA